MTAADLTVGHFMRRPEVLERRAIVQRELPARVIDAAARIDARDELLDLHETIRLDRRLDVVARQLRTLADRLDDADRRASSSLQAGDLQEAA